MSTHRVSLNPGSLAGKAPGEAVVVDGEEAYHAVTVKRLNRGEKVLLLDGRGVVAGAEVVEAVRAKGTGRLTVKLESVQKVDRETPRLAVWTAVPKGDRASQMVDQLAQLGAAEWCPLATTHGVAEAGDHKLGRMERIAAEASKQCGRAWHMEIGKERTMAEAVAKAKIGLVVMADASGQAWEGGAEEMIVLVGPEGGWTDAEWETLKQAGVKAVRFGPHVMRIETAAVAAAGVIMDGGVKGEAALLH